MVYLGPIGMVQELSIVLEPQVDPLHLQVPPKIIKWGNNILEYLKGQTPPCVA